MLMHRPCVPDTADSGEPDNKSNLRPGITHPGYNVNGKAVTPASTDA
jgi:hypothetical protein